MIKQITILTFLSFALVGLAGCVTTTDYKKSLQTANTCCSQLSDVKYKKLEYNKAASKALGEEGDKARLFKSGKSFYFPVELPSYEGAFEIQIESTPVNNKIFIPRIALLDSKHRTIKRISSSSFVMMNGAAKHKFFVNKDLSYRYMVLYTSPADLGKTGKRIQDTSQATPIFAGGYIFYYTHGADTTSTITSAEGGKLSVKILKYAPVKIGGN